MIHDQAQLQKGSSKNRFSRVSRNTISFEVYAATSVLSRTFQSGNLNFSRISPNIHVTKTKLQETHAENKVLVELDKDLGKDGRLSLCNITLPESTRSLTENRVKSYVEIISSNTDSSNST